MDFFTNPLSTPVGQRIEKATSDRGSSDQLVLQLEICDIINETEEGAADAVKALKKRLFGNKAWETVHQALAVLEICVKNCGRRFHVLIAKKDFLDQLLALSQPKVAAPSSIREKALGLLQSWADSFRGRTELQPVCAAYDSLRQQGVEFPAQDLDTLAPIYTPHRSVPEGAQTSQSSQQPVTESSAPPPVVDQPQSTAGFTPLPYPDASSSYAPMTLPVSGVSETPASQSVAPAVAPAVSQAQYPQLTVPMADIAPVQLLQQQQQPVMTYGGPTSPTMVAKVRSELDMVQKNITVLGEMTSVLTPGQEATADYEFMLHLHQTCREMQSRIAQLLASQHDESLTGDLLTANDMLNGTFLSFDEYQDIRRVSLPEQAVPAATDQLVHADGANQQQQQQLVDVPPYSQSQPITGQQQDFLVDVSGPTGNSAATSATSASDGTATGTDDFSTHFGQLTMEPPAYRPMSTPEYVTSGIPSSSQTHTTPSTGTGTTAMAAATESDHMFAGTRQAGFAVPTNAYELPADVGTFSDLLSSRAVIPPQYNSGSGVPATATATSAGSSTVDSSSASSSMPATGTAAAMSTSGVSAAAPSPYSYANASASASQGTALDARDAGTTTATTVPSLGSGSIQALDMTAGGSSRTAPASTTQSTQDTETVSQWLAANDLADDVEVIDEKAVEDVEPMTTDEFDMFLSAQSKKGKKKKKAVKEPETEKKPARRARPMMVTDENENDGLFAL